MVAVAVDKQKISTDQFINQKTINWLMVDVLVAYRKFSINRWKKPENFAKINPLIDHLINRLINQGPINQWMVDVAVNY
uniref:Uncharacterized protein n=1 Tax=Ditylenchus dipsaci TaxID=166011 RepID=A0A915E3V8_9BILA